MRIEYAITFLDGKPHMTHRVITDDGGDLGGGPGGTGGDPGGGPGGTGGDPGGSAGGTGGDPGGGPGSTGGDPGGAASHCGCGQSIIVMGPTVITACGCGNGSGLSFARRPIPATHVIAGSKPPILTPGKEGFVASPVKLDYQEQTYWCWAAVGSSVHTFFKAAKTLAQCQVANAVVEMLRLITPQSTPVVDLCTNPQTGNDQKSLKFTLGTLGNLKNADLGGVPDFARIQEEIALDRPIGCRIAWDTYGDGFEEGAHFVMIAGWKVDGAGNKVVQVLDPDGGTAGIPGAAAPRDVVYEQFRDAYEGTGKWVASYFVKAVA